MKKVNVLKHEFVEYIPHKLDEATIYVSISYATAVHKCCCGCGNEVVTPLSPTDWKLTFDGETVSLFPSIGNWSFPCKSHYWIRSNRVDWASQWSPQKIEAARALEVEEKREFYRTRRHSEVMPKRTAKSEISALERLWQRLKIIFFR